MTKKTYFEAPQAELIVVRFEENFLLSGGEQGKAGQDLGKGNSYYFDDED